jgi:hypothetical protein
MSILDGMIKSSFASNKKETPEQRKKRLIDEGKATESDFADKPDQPTPVLDESWSAYASAKAADDEKKKKKKALATKAGRAVASSQADE